MNKSFPPFGKNDVKILARQSCYSGFLKLDKFQLRHRLYAGGWSQPLQREMLGKDPAVGILLFDPDRDEVVLVRQFRIGAIEHESGAWLLELVAGMVEKGEDPEQVAIRESREEADCVPVNLIRICSYFNSPGTTDEHLTLFCGRVNADQASGVHGLSEEHEDIEVVVMPLDKVVKGIANGAINNAMTIIALQWLQLNKTAVLQAWSAPA